MSDLARKAYEAYSEIVEVQSKRSMIGWEELDRIARQAWYAAVAAVEKALEEARR